MIDVRVIIPPYILWLGVYDWIMNARVSRPVATTSVLILVLLVCGCISVSVGDVSYGNGTLAIRVTDNTGPSDGYIQVTVYRIQDLHQQEFTVIEGPVILNKGENTIFFPAQIGSGQYKLYVYLIQNGERKTAVIRDIVV
jgi:predicted PurR-regulated permease PerM